MGSWVAVSQKLSFPLGSKGNISNRNSSWQLVTGDISQKSKLWPFQIWTIGSHRFEGRSWYAEGQGWYSEGPDKWDWMNGLMGGSIKKLKKNECKVLHLGRNSSIHQYLSVWKAALWKRTWVFFHRDGGSWWVEWETRTMYPEGSDTSRQKNHSSLLSPVENTSCSDLGSAAEDNIEFPELSPSAVTSPVTNADVLTLINFGCKKGEIHQWKGVTNVYM